MKKMLCLIVFALLFCVTSANAHVLTVQAYDFTKFGGSGPNWPSGATITLVNNDSGYTQTFFVNDSNQGLYTFNVSDNQGYMLTGGDNVTFYQDQVQISGSAGDQSVTLMLQEVQDNGGN